MCPKFLFAKKAGYTADRNGNMYSPRGKVLKPSIRGYARVTVYFKKQRRFMQLHRFVYMYFKGNINGQINHVNGNKLDNALSNLEDVTASYNLLHAFRLGLKKANTCARAVNGVSNSVVHKIRTQRKLGMSYRTIAKNNKVSLAHCWMIVNNKRRKENANVSN